MGYTVTENGSAYDRGVAAGQIAERLAGHDRHFESINGSIGKLAAEMQETRLHVQRLADAMTADQATRIATVTALEKSDKARWVPWQKILAVAAVLIPLAALVAYVWVSARGH